MRILMISDVFFPRVNGVSTSIQSFKTSLEELGYEITLITPEYGTDDPEYNSLYRVASRRIPFDPEDRMMKTGELNKLFSTFKEHQFDLIHIQTPFVAHYAGIRLAQKLKIPVIESYHTHFEACLHHYLPIVPGAITRFITKWINRKQCNKLDGLIVPTQEIKDILISQDIHVPIEIIPTGVDEYFFKPGNKTAFLKKQSIDPNRPILVHIGRIAYEKNIEFLIHVIKEITISIPDILLVIAGEGPAKNHLQKLTIKMQLQDNVTFVGYLDRNTSLVDCYSIGKVFIFSSKIETQGLVLLEAMAQGIPVVSLSSMGANAILNVKKGAIIAEDDISDFTEKVISILSDTSLHSELSREAIEYARTWSTEAFAQKTTGLYEQVYKTFYAN